MDKRRLTRIVRTSEGTVVVDLTGKQNGRGAYLCPNPDCWEQGLNNNLLDIALRAEVSETDKKNLKEYKERIG
jgi:predicted RNA-binding protein YlxR (DUF448 family)